ncbi:MAG: TRAM domain-containing protein, partial [Microcystis sp.]
MQQGDLIEIEITDLNHTGEGVGKYRGQVIFVPDTV